MKTNGILQSFMLGYDLTNEEMGRAFREDFAVIHQEESGLWLTIPTKNGFDHIELEVRA